MKTEQRVSKHEREIVQKKRLQNLASNANEQLSFQIYGQVIVLLGPRKVFGILFGGSLHFLGIGYYGEFDPGSGRTLAACLIHASRAGLSFGIS